MTRHSVGLFVAVSLLVIVVACSGGATAVPTAAQGAETGVCFPNGTCNAGLVCLSNTCVNPGADGGGLGDATSGDGGGQSDSATDGGGPSDSATDTGGSRDTGTGDARDDAGLLCPGANILHPGNQTRMVNTSVPFVGRGRDASCAAITGASLVWVDSLEGQIGTGETFNHTFTMIGSHTVTLTATDSQSNTFTATVTFMIM